MNVVKLCPPIALLLITLVVLGCDKRSATENSSQPQRVEAQPFHGQVYRSINGQNALTLVSSDELELREGNTTLLCKYSKQPDALRVVMTAMGTNQVIYFRFINVGLQDNEGRVFLSPQAYVAAVEQSRIAQERAENEQREAERQQKEHQAHLTDLLAKAKEHHRTIRTESVLSQHFQTFEPAKIVLTDADMTYSNERITRVIWFGDIRKIEPLNQNPPTTVINTSNGGDWFISFSSQDQENDFNKCLTDTIQQWQAANAEILNARR